MFKTTKSKVIFVAIFSVICIAITVLLVIYKNIDIKGTDEKNSETISENNKEKDVPGIDLKGTYDQNDIKFEEKSATLEKVEIRYCQISGLKDKTIEEKINKELEQIALNCYKEKIKDLDEVVNVTVNMWKMANFANTISFELSYFAKIDDDSDDFYQDELGINYDLTTGEQITLDKIFTSDAPIENILRKSVYYSLIQYRVEESLNGYLIVNDYGEIEDEVAEFINSYKKGNITQFYYTPRNIFISYGENQVITIHMDEYPEYIAIYNRYLTDESIYTSNEIGLKNVYTLSERFMEGYYYANYQKEDNYFIDIAIDYSETEDDKFGKNLVQEKIKAIESEIEKVKQLAIENPNNFYILNYYILVYTGAEGPAGQILTTYHENGNSYEITVHDFEESIEPIIKEYNRQYIEGPIPSYVYDFSDSLKIEPQIIEEYYNSETGEKVVI